MQDRFKFRGITKGKVNKFVYGSLLWHAGESQIWDKDGKNYIVKPKTVQQCTGLKDKNGKLIYEGDIINIWCKNLTKNQISDVFYCEERAAFCFHYETDYGNIVPCTMDKTEIEIIGNIYENKELLESEG